MRRPIPPGCWHTSQVVNSDAATLGVTDNPKISYKQSSLVKRSHVAHDDYQFVDHERIRFPCMRVVKSAMPILDEPSPSKQVEPRRPRSLLFITQVGQRPNSEPRHARRLPLMVQLSAPTLSLITCVNGISC